MIAESHKLVSLRVKKNLAQKHNNYASVKLTDVFSSNTPLTPKSSTVGILG